MARWLVQNVIQQRERSDTDIPRPVIDYKGNSIAGRLFFEIRLWDSGDLVDVLLENYERLPEDLKAELPLKRIWTLVPEE